MAAFIVDAQGGAVPRRQADTRGEIREAALALFNSQGFSGTSLREIAESLEITKAALYYHFPSKDALLEEIVRPMLDAGDAFVRALEAEEAPTRRQVLEGYFDFVWRQKGLLRLFLFDPLVLSRVGGALEALIAWRERLLFLLYGPEPTDEQRVLAVFAVGGVQDAAFLGGGGEHGDDRELVVAAALRVLDPPSRRYG